MANEAALKPRQHGGALAPARMSRGRFWLALAGCLAGIAILLGLGTWQVERLAWKEALLARIDARIHAEPVDLATLRQRYDRTGDIAYMPVTVHGRFLNADERYFLSTFDGDAGWNVYTPLVTDGGDVLFVNRGFVPYDLRDPARRGQGLVEGEVTVTGLAREVPKVKPGYFVPANDPAKNTFFWRDLAAMAPGVDLPKGAALLPFFVDAGPGRAPGGWPVGGTTVVAIPNNHLQYAFTWYGLALVLAAMTVGLVVRDRRMRKPQPPVT